MKGRSMPAIYFRPIKCMFRACIKADGKFHNLHQSVNRFPKAKGVITCDSATVVSSKLSRENLDCFFFVIGAPVLFLPFAPVKLCGTTMTNRSSIKNRSREDSSDSETEVTG